MATTTRKFTCASFKATRIQKDGSPATGDGDDQHILWGPTGSGSSQYHYRSLLKFNNVWTGVKRVVKIELVFKTETNSTHFSYGSKPKVLVQRLVAGFSDGANGENVWNSGEYQNPGTEAPGATADIPINPATGTAQDEAWVFVDVTAISKPMVPTSVLMPDGSHGGGKTNYGYKLRAPGDETDTTSRGVGKSLSFPTSADRPYVLLTYDTQNQAPVAPTLTGPATTNNTFADQFTGIHSDPDGDPMAAREIVVWPSGVSTAGKEVWKLPANLQSAGSDESQTGAFSVPLSLAAGSLKLQTAYEWVARTQ